MGLDHPDLEIDTYHTCGGRRGSGCKSKRGSICAYNGGHVCEVTPVGEVCKPRIAMMKSDTEMVTNGHGGKIAESEVW